MYLTAVILTLCASYFVILELFSLFFDARAIRPTGSKAIRSVAIIFIIALFGYAVALYIPDLEWGNRVLHGFVGGFLTFLICFLAAKDGGFKISRLQFFIFSALVVTALGVLNEHVELFLQTYVRLLFYSNPNDTWLDLISNTVGILIAAVCFVPFLNRATTSPQK